MKEFFNILQTLVSIYGVFSTIFFTLWKKITSFRNFLIKLWVQILNADMVVEASFYFKTKYEDTCLNFDLDSFIKKYFDFVDKNKIIDNNDKEMIKKLEQKNAYFRIGEFHHFITSDGYEVKFQIKPTKTTYRASKKYFENILGFLDSITSNYENSPFNDFEFEYGEIKGRFGKKNPYISFVMFDKYNYEHAEIVLLYKHDKTSRITLTEKSLTLHAEKLSGFRVLFDNWY